MNEKTHAVAVIARRQVHESVLSPSLYVSLAVGLFLGYFLVSGFARAVDSSGFSPQHQPLYDIIVRALEGTFGATFVGAIFSEGPLRLAFAACYIPAFLAIALSSVLKFGLERSAGAVELVAYGPADGTSYMLACYVKDVVLSFCSIVVITAFLAVAAPIYNYVTGPWLLVVALVAFFVSLALFAFIYLASMITRNAASSLALFIGIAAALLAVLLGSLAVSGDRAGGLTMVLVNAMTWISPFHYGYLVLRANETGSGLEFFAGLALMVVLSVVNLAVSHVIMRTRGVRA